MKKLLMFGMVLSVIFITFSACDDQIEDFHFDEKTFMSNWNAWNNKNIKNYSFTLFKSWGNNARGVPDYASYEWKIVVKDGVMDSFEHFFYEDPSFPFPEENHKSVLPFTSISDMYQNIYNKVQEQKESQKKWPDRTVEFILEYNNELNYITFYTLNVNIPNLSGSPMSPFRVFDFKILD